MTTDVRETRRRQQAASRNPDVLLLLRSDCAFLALARDERQTWRERMANIAVDRVLQKERDRAAVDKFRKGYAERARKAFLDRKVEKEEDGIAPLGLGKLRGLLVLQDDP
jgi:hypothetical protein